MGFLGIKNGLRIGRPRKPSRCKRGSIKGIGEGLVPHLEGPRLRSHVAKHESHSCMGTNSGCGAERHSHHPPACSANARSPSASCHLIRRDRPVAQRQRLTSKPAAQEASQFSSE